MQDKELIRIQRDLAVALNSESDLDAALVLCLATALDVTGMDGGGIYLLNSEGGLDLAVVQGFSATFTEFVGRLGPETQHAAVVREGAPIYARVEDTPDAIRESCQKEGLRSLAVLPIRHLGESIACMNLSSRAFCELPEAMRHQLEGIAAILGGAIARLRAEASCREGQQTLRALLDASTESAFLLDLEGVVLVANQTLAERLNTTVAELVGRPIASFVPPDLLPGEDLIVNALSRQDSRKAASSSGVGDISIVASSPFATRVAESCCWRGSRPRSRLDVLRNARSRTSNACCASCWTCRSGNAN